jgi:hypothetical protein
MVIDPRAIVEGDAQCNSREDAERTANAALWWQQPKACASGFAMTCGVALVGQTRPSAARSRWHCRSLPTSSTS